MQNDQYINAAPDEIIQLICEYLYLPDLFALMCTSSRMCAIVRNRIKHCLDFAIIESSHRLTTIAHMGAQIDIRSYLFGEKYIIRDPEDDIRVVFKLNNSAQMTSARIISNHMHIKFMVYEGAIEAPMRFHELLRVLYHKFYLHIYPLLYAGGYHANISIHV